MLLPNELNEVKENKIYKKRKRALSNLKYTTGLVNKDVSVDIDFKLNKESGGTWGLKFRVFLFLFKPFVIAKEIADLRSNVVEIYLNKTMDNSNIIDILQRDSYVWMEYRKEKVVFIKTLCKELLCDSAVQELVLNACKSFGENEKINMYKKMISNIDETFEGIINDCKKKSFTNDLFKTFIDNKVEKMELVNIWVQHGKSGLLTDVEKGE